MQFDTSKISTEITILKRISPSGFLITENTEGRDVKQTVHSSVYYKWMMKTKTARYDAGKKVCLLSYDGKIIDIEPGPVRGFNKENFDNWVPNIHVNLTKLTNLVDDSWTTDGMFIYQWDKRSLIETNKDSPFSRWQVRAINLFKLKSEPELGFEDFVRSYRTVIGFEVNGSIIPSPTIGMADEKKGMLKKMDLGYSLHTIDEAFYVNVDVALKLAQIVGKAYGYEKNEFLEIPKLMINYKTINIAHMPKAVKKVSPISRSLLSVIAWVIGLTSKEQDIYTLQEFQKVFVTLFNKGVVAKDRLKEDNYTASEPVPLVSFG